MDTKKIIAVVIAFAAVIVIAWMGVRFSNGPKVTQNVNKPKLIGGDTDEHGCLIGAGYSWCEAKQKCLKVWEETCDTNEAEIKVTTPVPDAVVTSPLEITGQAKGSWFFEAVFPVKLVDENGQELAHGQAQAQQDWMSVGLVPFKATLIFSPGAAKAGKIIFQNDNPSGQPENAKSFEVPVRFGE